MFLDAFCNLTINRKVIKLFGLYTAVYWAELLLVSEQVVRKKTFDDSGYFRLDREYVAEQTCISIEEQLKCDEILSRTGILQQHPADSFLIKLDIGKMVSLITDRDAQMFTKVTNYEKLTSDEQNNAKKKGLVIGLQKVISKEIKDSDIKMALCNWVEALVEADKPVGKAVYHTFYKEISEYTDDKNKIIEIINTAAALGYRKAEWAINKVDKPGLFDNITRPEKKQRVSDEVSDITF